MPRGAYKGYVRLEAGEWAAAVPQAYRSSRVIINSMAHQPDHYGHLVVDESIGCKVYYEVHNVPLRPEPSSIDNFCNVLMLHGLACGVGAWWPQIQGFMTSQSPPPGTFLRVCLIDNRGVGKSSAPKEKKHYSTEIMAQDALAVMQKELHWSSCHVVGFSMGGMISTKLASMAPEFVRSLTLIGVTGGGWQCIPKTWKGFKYLVKGMMAARTPEARASVDLSFHFARHTLKEYVSLHACTRKDLLVEEYVMHSMKQEGKQDSHGLEGQLHSCWTHKVTKKDIKAIVDAKFPVMYIHGRHDLLAGMKYAQKLADKMHASFFVLDGAHFITRECGHQVNSLLSAFVISHQSGLDLSSFLEPRTSRGDLKINLMDAPLQSLSASSFHVEASLDIPPNRS